MKIYRGKQNWIIFSQEIKKSVVTTKTWKSSSIEKWPKFISIVISFINKIFT